MIKGNGKKRYFFKKCFSIALIWSILFGSPAYAQIPFVEGGLIGDVSMTANTYEYEELFFMTGKPVVLKGTLKMPQAPDDKDKYTLKVTFDLSNVAERITLTRAITYDIVKTQKSNITQTLYEKTISKFDETITTPEGTFTLGKYSFSDSRLFDQSPSVSYFSGHLVGERTYYLNGDYITNSGSITVLDEGDPIVGYIHEWGESETLVNHQEIQHVIPNPNYDATVIDSKPNISWQAVLDQNLACTKTVDFIYQGTDPQSISFRGSYFKVTSEENVLTAKYDLPIVKADGAIDYEATKRNVGEINKSKEVILETKPLITPKIRDISGHWANQDVFLLTSLEIFDVDQDYFAPDAYISRLEFGKAVVNALEGVLPEATRTDLIKRKRPGVTTPYLDVLPDDPDYQYYEYIKAHNLMAGENSYFKPNNPITRAEMVAVLITALGLEYLAPNPPYKTVFTDDDRISEWAKDFVYMANEIGLITGYDDGSFKPLNRVTKAEAASMIHALIKHLKDEITYDYREKIINR
ncbi:S-layer homology domain-containing protein [Fusibacter sp. 3D3]|uniref:S-layer homology domain-containing protein n=1 Tax=Fusibacter sp. 3D3 TaxID=1048380 RepID=UPI0008535143|nr:S-layer homology domain-containing protein [Fusibacter sp. 3D3]GAU77806.1 hypothetical protein F3D3_2435 [Fusibacter sp. 3D3]